MKDITMLIAHPDDEVIFGWPVLKEAKKIICCANDYHDRTKRWEYSARKEALMEIGAFVDAEVVSPDRNCDFHKLSGLNGELNDFIFSIYELLKDERAIFTHNPWGEYGHLDHILAYTIAKNSGKTLIVTDIVQNTGWYPVFGWEYGNSVKQCEVDKVFYEKCKAIYVKHNCWTWHLPCIEKTRLYYV